MQNLLALFFILSMLTFSKCATEKVIITEGHDVIEMNFGDLVVKVDPINGAKVVSTNYKDVELLSSRDTHAEYYGSSLWLSPFKKYWPQPSALDVGSYTYSLIPNGVRLTSQADTSRGLVYEKTFKIEPLDTTLLLQYTIKNIGADTIQLAAWEVTRVPKDGITFFPLGDLSLEESILIDPSVRSELKDGILWHYFTPANKITGKMKPKLYTDGSEGWLAYTHKNILLIKEFNDVALTNQAPGEKEIEIYVKDVINYIELENQGEYFNVVPGDSVFYQTKWHFIDLQKQFETKYLNEKLVQVVRKKVL